MRDRATGIAVVGGVASVNGGPIDVPFVHRLRPELTAEDMLRPDASAWTQERDVRPFKERF